MFWMWCWLHGYIHFVKIHQIKYLSCMHFTVDKFYLEWKKKKSCWLLCGEQLVMGQEGKWGEQLTGSNRYPSEGQGSLVCCRPWGRKESRHGWVAEQQQQSRYPGNRRQSPGHGSRANEDRFGITVSSRTSFLVVAALISLLSALQDVSLALLY